VPIVPAPDVGTYSTQTQYVTVKEFLAAPTGLDVSSLVVGGNVAQNQHALEMQLQRASAWVDNYCQQTIAATVDIQAGQYRVSRVQGLGSVVKVPLDFTPVIAISDVQVGYTPSGMSELSDLSNVWIGRKVVTIPITTYGDRVFAQVQYVNGYANTALTVAPAAGAMSLTVASALGIMPGQGLSVQSATNAETVTIDPSWVPSNTAINVSVPLTTPLVSAYSIGDTVTAFPQDIKQAVILVAKSLILTKGSQAITIPTYNGQPSHIQAQTPTVSNDMDMAKDLLSSYRRVM
jgi:hypothetical protein